MPYTKVTVETIQQELAREAAMSQKLSTLIVELRQELQRTPTAREVHDRQLFNQLFPVSR
jgi:hypothetical protein